MESPTSLPRKKIFIVEDHPVFREGLVHILNEEEDLTVCGMAGDAETALRPIARLKPDLALVDISLPGKSGLDLIKELRSAHHRLKLLVVSMHDEALYADRVLQAGADGYIMKQEDPTEVIEAVRDVLSGRIYVSEEVLGKGTPEGPPEPVQPEARPLTRFTDAELEIMEMLGQGNSNEEIARRLRCTVSQVSTHCLKMRNKLRLPTYNALIRHAVCWVEAARV